MMTNERILELSRQAEAWIEAHRAEFIEEIQGLARIPSVSRADEGWPGAPFGEGCRRAVDHMLETGRRYGFDTQDLDGYAAVVSMGDAENALGIIAHLDVVPVGDGWVYPPFGATYLPEHDALVGRGVDDNKGSAIAGLFVMRMLRDLNIPMRHGVKLYGGTSEETGMEDMKALLERGERFPALSIVPDAGFPVNYGQKGGVNADIRARIDGNLLAFDAGSAYNIIPDRAECLIDRDLDEVRAGLMSLPDELRGTITAEAAAGGTKVVSAGVSGHAASPDRSVNAIHLLARALTEARLLTGSARDAVAGLARLSEDAYGISEGAAFEDEISGKTTLVYSIAHLKDGWLTVCADCRFSINYDAGILQKRLADAWAALGYEIEKFSVSRPFYMPKDDPRIQALMNVYTTITGRDEQPYTMGGGTYSRVVPNAISFGPGMQGPDRLGEFLPEGHGHAHGRDEALPMEKVLTAAKIYLAAMVALDEMI